jgi:hypothetical protein
MLRICALGLAVATSTRILAAAGFVLPPLASSSAVPCSKRAGTRATRSDLVQLGNVTVSLGEQASREGNSCMYSAALWITQNDVSQQVDLPGAEKNAFSIIDVAPDASSILLAARNGPSTQLAVFKLPDGALKWMPTTEWLGLRNCDAAFEPQGYLDTRHIVLAAASRSSSPACEASADLYSVDLDTHRTTAIAYSGLKRVARSVSGPIHSCKSDPDVVQACYRARARLGLSSDGPGLSLWTIGSNHLLAVDEDMVPSDLRLEVTPQRRVYASMLICPMALPPSGRRAHVCVDSASDFRPDPVVPQRSRPGVTRR